MNDDEKLRYLGIVGRLLDDFRSHPKRCPHKRVSFAGGVRKLASNAEIG